MATRTTYRHFTIAANNGINILPLQQELILGGRFCPQPQPEENVIICHEEIYNKTTVNVHMKPYWNEQQLSIEIELCSLQFQPRNIELKHLAGVESLY